MYTLGIDIGSTSSKAVILENGNSIVARSLYALGAGTSGAARVIDDLFEKANLSWDDISYCIATGYGRQRFDQANEEISELSCHALGMNHLLPGIRTIIDIGGQDVKVLSLNDQGMLENFVINEKCAAGTGRFLDVMAGVLETTTDELGNLDAQATDPVKISSPVRFLRNRKLFLIWLKVIRSPILLQAFIILVRKGQRAWRVA